jgi:hypothetical protein
MTEETSMNRKRISQILAVLVLSLGLAGCEQTRIAAINADPGSYGNKEVAIAGKVTNSMGALGKGIYQVDDGTGQLWVYSSSRGVPSKGTLVGVKGRVKPTFSFMGQNFTTVMLESERRDEKK